MHAFGSCVMRYDGRVPGARFVKESAVKKRGTLLPDIATLGETMRGEKQYRRQRNEKASETTVHQKRNLRHKSQGATAHQ